jgi:hypothetical protein
MDAYRPRLRSWLVVAAIVVVSALVFRGARARWLADPHAPLRDSLAVLRVRADSCRAEVDGRAAQLRAYDRRLDSMRARVRELESLPRRGVPIDSYSVYMAKFNAYNDSAAAWPPLEDTVRALDAHCRTVAEQHNALADSLRQLVFPIPDP